MLEKMMKPGDKIEISHLFVKGDTGMTKKYICQLVDLPDDSHANISMPIEGGQMVPLEIGERYQLFFYTTNGLYQTKGIVTERFRSNKIFVATLRFLSDVESFQRRQFYRLECIMDIQFRVIGQEEQKILEKLVRKDYKNEREQAVLSANLKLCAKEWQFALATDISGGGLRFNTKKAFTNAEYMEVRMPLVIGRERTEICEMVRLVYSGEVRNRPGLFENRVEFMNIPTKEREAIIRYIFNEERLRRKNRSENGEKNSGS